MLSLSFGRTAGRVGLGLAVLLAATASLPAGTISSLNVTGWGISIGSGVVVNPQLDLRFTISSQPATACWDPSPTCLVILEQVLTAGDIGATYSANASNNADFAAIAAALTNGVDNEFTFSSLPNPGGGVGVMESTFPGAAPDFAGHSIAQIDLTVNNITFPSVFLPTPPAGGRVFTFADPDVTISLLDTAVPEPGTVAGILTGLVVLTCLGRRRRPVAAA